MRKVIGVTMDWYGQPTLQFDNGKILYGGADRILYPEYWKGRRHWPIDPKTGENLKIAQ